MSKARLALEGLCIFGACCACLVLAIVGLPYWLWKFYRDETQGAR